jgi:uncharacterized membrane protein
MEISAILNALFRWIHIIAGITWIGLLYFFNWVNIPFAAKMKEAGAGKTVVPELMPRALYWFRWGAAWTWVTGVLLLTVVFYHGGIMFEHYGQGWGLSTFVMLAVVFGGVFIYDAIYKSSLASNPKVAHTVSFIIIAIIVVLMVYWAGFSYRAYVIHTGALFGTIMAFNVWFRIWPAQQKIITATKNGEAPDPALLALAGSRSRHNTYLSVPLIWCMIDTHTTVASGSWAVLLIAILVGWHVVFQLYAKSLKIQGF